MQRNRRASRSRMPNLWPISTGFLRRRQYQRRKWILITSMLSLYRSSVVSQSEEGLGGNCPKICKAEIYSLRAGGIGRSRCNSTSIRRIYLVAGNVRLEKDASRRLSELPSPIYSSTGRRHCEPCPGGRPTGHCRSRDNPRGPFANYDLDSNGFGDKLTSVSRTRQRPFLVVRLIGAI